MDKKLAVAGLEGLRPEQLVELKRRGVDAGLCRTDARVLDTDA
ncbi:MAG: hypothetical protein VX293_12890 [Candidatus Latescibacterota bacterium]|nr:hypothetical protein [Candidatus Latescibacterota bacterium]